MQAMVLQAANTPFVLETLPDPESGPGEAVARVLAYSFDSFDALASSLRMFR